MRAAVVLTLLWVLTGSALASQFINLYGSTAPESFPYENYSSGRPTIGQGMMPGERTDAAVSAARERQRAFEHHLMEQQSELQRLQREQMRRHE